MLGAEEDFVKCLRPTYVGDFGLKGKELRLKGQNRIGNLIVENQNYCDFEDWIQVSAPRGLTAPPEPSETPTLISPSLDDAPVSVRLERLFSLS